MTTTSKLPDRCIICGGQADATIWEAPVCPKHFTLWGAESPLPSFFEERAKPEHFEDVVRDGEVVAKRLRAGLLERAYTRWTAEWANRTRSALRGGAA